MRKAISLFLAASVLCLATSAMAVPSQSGDVSGTLNLSNGSTSTGTRNGVTGFGNAENAASMPCFRPGDVIIFTIGNLTAGEELTLITYKNGETPSDSTVQYINQYTVSGTTQAVNYTIRDLTSGIYMLELNGGTSGKKTFYYKVGDASVQVLDNDAMDGRNHGTFKSGEGDPYIIKQAGNGKWSVGFIGKVIVESGDITLGDIGANPGFSITNGSKTKKYGYGFNGQKAVSALDATTKYEISGSYSLIYGLTMYNVTDGSQSSIKATAVLDADE